MFAPLPTYEMLVECFDYDAQTGNVFWRSRPREHFGSDRIWKSFNGKHVGKEAFTMRDGCGYKKGKVFGREVFAHRVIWKLVTGDDPHGEIDHVNGCRDDNRWRNLRVVTHSANMKNTRLRQDNKTGVAGVSIRNGRFCARVQSNGVRMNLGYFDTLEDAKSEVLRARKDAGMHVNHGATVRLA